MGQLLMVARPAALLTTPPTSAAAQPSLDQLHSALQQPGQAQEASRRALQVLYDGSEASSQRLLKPQALASCQYVSAVEPQEGSDASSRLHQALKLNAFGESLPDAAAWVARGQVKAMRSYVGVWPGQAMYNHSCSPNASAMPLLQGAAAGTAAEAAGSSAGTALFQQHDVPQGSGGDAGPGPGSEMLMLVRAARNMKAGDEVTIAYTDRCGWPSQLLGAGLRSLGARTVQSLGGLPLLTCNRYANKAPESAHLATCLYPTPTTPLLRSVSQNSHCAS